MVSDLPHMRTGDPHLWYSVGDVLVHIQLDPATGEVDDVVTSTITNPPGPPPSESRLFNAITMLDDGSLLGAREIPYRTEFYHVAQPPTSASQLAVDVIGSMPDDLVIEALYTDCDGRVYLMDTGTHAGSADGNRLLRFTGNFLAGDFAYDEVTDLSVAVAPDIDDMAPGIDDHGEIVDNPGFALDSSVLYVFDYTTGTGSQVATGGTYGVHALGGSLFDDATARLYVLNLDGQLFHLPTDTWTLSAPLATGPSPSNGNFAGMSGLAGPLTNCTHGFSANVGPRRPAPRGLVPVEVGEHVGHR